MSKQVVLITGCSKGGIGYSLAKKFAQEGNQVFATARRIESLEGLEEFGCEKLTLDVTDNNSIQTAVQAVIDQVGHIDILVNNAGQPAVGALLDIDFEAAHQCINTNVFGVLAVIRPVAKQMAKQNRGKIINIGSIVGYASTPWAGIYSASKAAVHSLSDTLRMELKPFNIQVSVVAPGAITSNFGIRGTNQVNIPEDSLYASLSEFIIGRANASQGPKSTPTDVFANHVVSKVLQKSMPRYISYGTNSFTFILFYYLPLFIKELILSRVFGLTKLKKK